MLSEEEFRKTLKVKPSITVDGVLFKDSTVLMVKRAHEPNKGSWALPGGFVEYKERLEDAVIRETKEETGLDVKPIDIVGIYDNPERDPRGHVIAVCFLLEFAGGEARTSKETSDVKFFRELPENIAFDHKQMIEDAKKLLKDND